MLPFFARTLPPLGVLLGIHLMWIGADAPGGAFQGGTVLAAMWLIVMMAGLRDAPAIGAQRLRLGARGGPGGVPRGRARRRARRPGPFSPTRSHIAKPLILLIEVPMLLTIALALGLLVAGPPDRAADPHDVGHLVRSVRRGAGRPRAVRRVVHPQPLRKLIAFNLLGSGMFLMFGVDRATRRVAGVGGDPVPQALVITGIVVAFAATALAVALLLRLFRERRGRRWIRRQPTGVSPERRES